ncbi:MAG: hypothetical protein HQ483_10645 [Rhodospirillales bacterium]|nr:hypothetical protein [Rhodospirillales bacterium]
MSRLIPAVLMLLAVMPGNSLQAQESDVFWRLQNEPVTVFDVGIKRLRAAVQIASQRLISPSEPKPVFRVQFDEKTRKIVVSIKAEMRTTAVSQKGCWALRANAIKEIFSVASAYQTAPLSVEARIQRRLALMFSREPVQINSAYIGLGERLAELTIVDVEFGTETPPLRFACRATAADLKSP